MVKNILCYLISMLMSLSLIGCSIISSESEWVYEGDDYTGQGRHIGVKLYGRYAENIPENYVNPGDGVHGVRKQVQAQHDVIIKNLEQADLSNYFSCGSRYSIIEQNQLGSNGDICLETEITIEDLPVIVTLRYGVAQRDGRYLSSEDTGATEDEVLYVNCFPEPIISITFSIGGVSIENTLMYTSDGELVGEKGEWLFWPASSDERLRDKYAEFYLKEMQKFIGKE